MSWYYAQDGQQIGPVEDDGFQRLVQAGAIKSDTLVWREGMAEWQPYGAVASASGQPSVAAAPPVVEGEAAAPARCSRCGQSFAREDLIEYSGALICAGCKPLFFQQLREGGQPQEGYEYGGFWLRVGAKLIDGLILMVPLLGLLGLAFLMIQTDENPMAALAVQLIFQVAFYGASALYSIFFVGRYGATPGKMAVGLQIITPEGGRVSYPRATGRFFAELLSGMICYIGYIMVAFDKEKRGLHDLICNTRVVKKPR